MKILGSKELKQVDFLVKFIQQFDLTRVNFGRIFEIEVKQEEKQREAVFDEKLQAVIW